MTTVLIALGDRSLRAGCLRQLDAAGYAPFVLRRPLELLSLAVKVRWDVVLIDQTSSGVETLRVLEGGGLPQAPTVGVGLSGPSLAASIPLPLVEGRLLSTIRDVISATKGVAPHVERELRLDPSRRVASAGARSIGLTRREFRLLQLLQERQPEVVTLDQVLEGVWGLREGGRADLIRAQVRNLRRKLAQIGLAEALQSRRGLGYSLSL